MKNLYDIPGLTLVPPPDFRVVAIIAAFNEEDIIKPVISHLLDQEIDVYFIDNWSTDSTYEQVKEFGNGIIGIERWPKDRPSQTYDWEAILKRKEQLAQEIDADWFIHYDADEIREAPWKWMKLKDAIYAVDQLGYNAVDFAVVEFWPVDNGFQMGMNPADYFQYYYLEVSGIPYNHTNAWKNLALNANISNTGGHTVNFPGRKVFPFQFILRHYPVRSQSHGEKKIHQERLSRYNPFEKKKGWHKQYDRYGSGTSFLVNPARFIKINENFHEEFLFRQMIEQARMMGTQNAEINQGQNLLSKFSQWVNRRCKALQRNSRK